jgi:uncharacterized protein YpuA (DUF1002 family)
MKIKRIISSLLVICLLSALTPVLAINEGDARAVIGADLTDAQKDTVYQAFSIKRESVPELTVTNSEEKTYLSGLVDPSVIGTRSISCVYVKIGKPNSGISVQTSNINWCTREMYMNALATAGITDAEIIVAAPFTVSGTAALTGIYKAYEDLTGEKISDEAKLASTQELVITAELADEIGSYDSVAIVNELKLILNETKNMTDDEVRDEIRRIAGEYSISITDGQVEQLLSLCRSLEVLDADALQAKVESVQKAIKNLATAKENASKFVAGVQNIFKAIGSFFSNLFGKKD